MEILEFDNEPKMPDSYQDLTRAFELLIQLPEDFLQNGREQLPVQEREG